MRPFCGNCLVEEGQDRRAELLEGFVVSIVGRVLMHEAPASLDRIEVRTIGWDEVQHALASSSLEPVAHAPGMMVAGIVQVDMDPSFLGMCNFDRLEQGDQASCIDLGHFQHLCLARLQIDRAMNVEGLATGCLFDGDRNTPSVPNIRRRGPDAWGARHRRTRPLHRCPLC